MSDLLLVLGPRAEHRLASLARRSPSRARLTYSHGEAAFAVCMRYHATETAQLDVTDDDILAVSGHPDLPAEEWRELLSRRPDELARLPGSFAAALLERRHGRLLLACDRSAMRQCKRCWIASTAG